MTNSRRRHDHSHRPYQELRRRRRRGFADHWLNVHGPLARQVPGMTAYSQNHIVERYPPIETPELHRVDGLSQLYFPDIATMAAAMETPEQRACVEDIKGFLSEVTIVIQRRGEVVYLGECSSRAHDAKLMSVLIGDPRDADAYAFELAAELRRRESGEARFRINPVVDRSFIVDPSVPRGNQIVGGILELWFTQEESLPWISRGDVGWSRTNNETRSYCERPRARDSRKVSMSRERCGRRNWMRRDSRCDRHHGQAALHPPGRRLPNAAALIPRVPVLCGCRVP